MDTRFIDSLVLVAETGSFAAAARAQNLTPAAVAQRVRSLEAELGESLIIRVGKHVAPTPACQSVLEQMRHIASAVGQLSRDIDTTGLGGPLRIGAISTALSDRLPGVLKCLATQAPKARLTITPGSSEALYTKLLNTDLDAIFVVRPPLALPKSLGEITLETQGYVLITQADDLRPASDILTQDKALIYDRNSWGGNLIEPWLRRHIAPHRILCELDALEAIAAAVSQGLGFAILPHWPGMDALPGLRHLTLPDLDHQRELVLLHRRLSPGIIDLLRR
ncbi:HTH-type transcriptional regulator GltR [Phaeobacter sp. CECT 5382]|uniref:LysR family transcriptional regulator n=1 Tax=Phaeobacter sp. CECT 5382 TaxID=1712645 RepID=UPI0006D99210|nr:LysR family transcriptional regulator [Phaeobacter sp. CECT 5382]CUH89203.1 HTH-type transcriptional regulator GltR [Phaeobacter sp. CECT 5382]